MYSTRLANDKHSEKTPQNQTKPGDGLSEMWTRGLIDMGSKPRRLKQSKPRWSPMLSDPAQSADHKHSNLANGELGA